MPTARQAIVHSIWSRLQMIAGVAVLGIVATACSSGSATPLGSLVLSQLPPSFHGYVSDKAQTGSRSLAEASKTDGLAEGTLTADGFTAGQESSWSQVSMGAYLGHTVDIFLYRFSTSSGAKLFATAITDQLHKALSVAQAQGAPGEAGGMAVTTFGVPGVPGAQGYMDSEAGQSIESVVTFTKGSYWCDAQVHSPGVTAAAAMALVQAQERNLPA